MGWEEGGGNGKGKRTFMIDEGWKSEKGEDGGERDRLRYGKGGERERMGMRWVGIGRGHGYGRGWERKKNEYERGGERDRI